jgi:epsilon-lactone hydrolase
MIALHASGHGQARRSPEQENVQVLHVISSGSDMMSESEIAALQALLLSRPRPASVAERRERLDALGAAYPIAGDIRLEPVSADGVPAEWSLSPGADVNRVLLYLHGGGFSAGSIVSHRAMVTESGRATQMRTLAIDYRRTPEHPFPAALDDALRAYRWLLAQGVQPGQIAVGGDSAGGGLTLALMVSLRDRGLPLPACGWCVSPWVDMEVQGESYVTKAAVDPMISRDYIRELADWYLHGTAPDTPLAAPIHADLAGLPPLLVQVGSAETLLDDSVGIAARAAAADVRVTLEVWPHMIHAWPLFHQQLTDGRRAIAVAGAFMRDALV